METQNFARPADALDMPQHKPKANHIIQGTAVRARFPGKLPPEPGLVQKARGGVRIQRAVERAPAGAQAADAGAQRNQRHKERYAHAHQRYAIACARRGPFHRRQSRFFRNGARRRHRIRKPGLQAAQFNPRAARPASIAAGIFPCHFFHRFVLLSGTF